VGGGEGRGTRGGREGGGIRRVRRRVEGGGIWVTEWGLVEGRGLGDRV